MSVIEMDRRQLRRKVTRVGNSLGITIPTEFIQSQGIQIGDEFDLMVSQHGEIVLRRVPNLPHNVRPEVLDLFAETFTEYEDVLRTLKDK